jgi:glycine cleavage system transcriptional repressor
MRTTVVFTLTGPDRVGIVEEVTEVLVARDCNVEISRMARLGGEFAMLMAVTVPADKREQLESAFEHLAAEGYRVCLSTHDHAGNRVPTDSAPYRIEVTGADHEGIVHEIARGLARAGINIESMETGTTPSPISGTPLFMMTAVVAVPPEVADSQWIATLDEAGTQAGVDITVSPLEE